VRAHLQSIGTRTFTLTHTRTHATYPRACSTRTVLEHGDWGQGQRLGGRVAFAAPAGGSVPPSPGRQIRTVANTGESWISGFGRRAQARGFRNQGV